ncbi:hypothetical protein [Acinetobacter haemolyticus]|uniref:hypothetical protein n=1 Tax=Acinetobacter haemolyticus TaxID=29430 RepID=UPI000301169C|nr:hypothetical protein [Acinetobacter haemolyticus]
MGGAIVASDPLGMNSYNIQLNQNTLFNNQYDSYIRGNIGTDPDLWTTGGLHLEIVKYAPRF